MVRAETEARILDMKGKATEGETADALGVSLYTVRRVWGTDEPAPTMEEAAEGREGPATYTALIASGYVRLIGSLEDQMERYGELENENPDNPEWARLRLRASEAYIAALEGMASITGLGSLMYLGEDGYTYSDEDITGYIDRATPPKVLEIETRDRIKEALESVDIDAMLKEQRARMAQAGTVRS